MIYYAIKPTFTTITRYVNSGDFDTVYDRIMSIVDDHERAADAADWCEIASVGETYETDLFTIDIIED